MEKTRFLTLVIVVLVVVNVVTLGFMFFRGSGGFPLPGGHPPVASFLIHELKLDKKQVKAYSKMHQDHHRNKNAYQRQLAIAREVFFRGLSTGDTSNIAGVTAVQRQMEWNTFRHFRELRALCRPDQQQRFDKVIQEALRRMSRSDGIKPPPPRK
jgi:hypothetical protein